MKRFFFRLGGTTYDVIKHCSPDIRTKYGNLAWSLFLSTGLAIIGGFDIARQFTTVFAICIGVGILWGIAVFFFDYFIINSSSGKLFFKLIRIPVGISNVTITVIALFVLLNQSTIDSKLLLTNTKKITRGDSTYLSNKQTRYAQVAEKKENIEAYHQKNCVPEALDGYPGPEYQKKHALCVTTDSAITRETAQLDTAEKTYHAAYQIERDALLKVSNADFFAKALLLPEIISANIMVLILAIALFIFLSYLELQSIMLKFSIDPNDEYHIKLRSYEEKRKGTTATQMDNEANVSLKKALLEGRKADAIITADEFTQDMQDTDAKTLRELEIRKRIKILRSKGYQATADQLEKKLQVYIKTGSASQDGSTDIFKMTNSMLHQLEEIRKGSNGDSLAENIFHWIVVSIAYDEGHSKE
ncbi:MAG TPA: DUF4407 domain-containing protein, partial [Pedobacter sp.]